MSADLRQSITPAELKKWTASADPAVWANESFSITRTLYRDAPNAKTGVDDAYFRQWLPTLNTCLEVGGVRLGALLNDALAPGSAKDLKGGKGAKDTTGGTKDAKNPKGTAPTTSPASPKGGNATPKQGELPE